MRILLSGLLLLALSSPALAQPAASPLRREMARVTFLVGEWEGTGWTRLGRDDQPISGAATGEGLPVLSGFSLGWKSQLRAAQGVMSASDVSLRFRRDSTAFRAFFHAPGQPARESWARVAECEASWGLQLPATQANAENHIRYTIRVDAQNRLTEVGERSEDGGRTWWQFYNAEMTGGSGEGCHASAAQAPAPATGG
jgi:hypothetical protein